MIDETDQVMGVMQTAFDPEFGEAWTRRQVFEALSMPNTFLLLAGADGGDLAGDDAARGFALSRGTAGEEELLLLGVDPQWRGMGIGRALLDRFVAAAARRGADRLFLEMREGNFAERLYRSNGFREIGRRRNYYNAGRNRRFDAITFTREIEGNFKP